MRVPHMMKMVALAVFFMASLTGLISAQPTVQENQSAAVTPSPSHDSRANESSVSSETANKTGARAPQSKEPQALTRTLQIEARGLTLRHPEGWVLVPQADPTFHELQAEVQVLQAGESTVGRARLQISFEPRLDHDDALQRLKQIASECDGQIAYVQISGWPAMQRQALTPLGRRDEAPEKIEYAPRLTLAIAAGDQIVRIESFLPPGASQELTAQAEAIGRSAAFAIVGDATQGQREVEMLRRSPPRRSTPYIPQPNGVGNAGGKSAAKAPATPNTSGTKRAAPKSAATLKNAKPTATPPGKIKAPTSSAKSGAAGAAANGLTGALPAAPSGRTLAPNAPPLLNAQEFSQELASPGLNRFVHQGLGELEITASNDGRNIVIAANSGFSNSTDGGRTFTFRGGTPGPNASVDGDPSLGTGASGGFYYGFIGFPDGTPAWNNQTGCATGISVSTNGGTSFTWRSNAVLCPQSGAGVCFPDQEHITADRFNAAAPGPGGGDQVYSTWRNFTPASGNPTCGNIGSGFVTPMLVCSSDSGNTWPTTRNLTGDFPRITTGPDGFVYVVLRKDGDINLYKFSSCSSGLNLQAGFPRTITAVTDVACPMPGLDRCNDGNLLSSHTVAVDDRNANHIYAAYATNTAVGNENIVVRDSTDGGTTWAAARAVTLNAPIAARRFMPWVTTLNGVAHVSWYDRRAGVGGISNDLTDFYRGSAFLDFAGNLVAGPEIKITQAADAQCASGWPCTPRANGDSEQCSVQPQNAGICKLNPLPMPDTSSNRRCDFSNCPGPLCPCNPGEVCQGGGGCPKYGDYNGIGAAGGRLITAWSSATSPPGLTPAPPAGINVYTSVNLVCCVPQIQVPSPPNFASTCSGTPVKATLNVCNTGATDLEVNSITSSNARFTATTPSAGFPVIVSSGFCFPFETTFTPNAVGAQNVNFTINTNDPVNPALTIAASALAQQPTISTVIADAGNFGNVCVGSFKDLDLTINNSGACDLRINSITSLSAEFQTAGVVSFPLIIGPGDSIQIPFRFQPTSYGMKTTTITINSNDPASPSKLVTVSGNAPPATIVAPDLLDFGKVCPGDTRNVTLTIGNSGGCDLIVKSIISDSPEFKVVGVVPFPLVVPPGSTREVTIQFMPMSFGNKMATLTIMSNDLVTPNKTVIVKGIAPPPVIQVVPASLDFGIVCLGKSKDLPVTIKNTGECNLTVSSVTFNSTEFKLVNPPPFPLVIPPGGSATLIVRFSPVGATGPRSAKMTINSDDPAMPVKIVNLTGEAPVSAIVVTGDFDFGTVTLGKVRDQLFEVTNTQPCDLLITMVCEYIEVGSPSGSSSSAEFRLISSITFPRLIPGGGTLPVTIRFKPLRPGLRRAKLVVSGFDPTTGTLLLKTEYELRGVGK